MRTPPTPTLSPSSLSCLALPSLVFAFPALPSRSLLWFGLVARRGPPPEFSPLLGLAVAFPCLCIPLPCLSVPCFALPCIVSKSPVLPCFAFPCLRLPCLAFPFPALVWVGRTARAPLLSSPPFLALPLPSVVFAFHGLAILPPFLL